MDSAIGAVQKCNINVGCQQDGSNKKRPAEAGIFYFPEGQMA